MDNRVLIPKEVAEEIKFRRIKGESDEQIFASIIENQDVTLLYFRYYDQELSYLGLANAISYGYRVEKGRHDRMLDYYETEVTIGTSKQKVIENTLDIMGIEIEGINC